MTSVRPDASWSGSLGGSEMKLMPIRAMIDAASRAWASSMRIQLSETFAGEIRDSIIRHPGQIETALNEGINGFLLSSQNDPLVRALLTGDIEPEVQSVLMAGPPLEAHVVKVPHHGSRYQVPQFARWSGARIALFSVGADNDYGHPSPATLQQYLGVGARIGRTDQQGGLAVVPTAAGLALLVSR